MIYIQNYTGDEAYTNADQQTKGIPLTAYKQDDLGRIIEKAEPGMGEFNGDGRYAKIDTYLPNTTDYNGITVELIIKAYSTPNITSCPYCINRRQSSLTNPKNTLYFHENKFVIERSYHSGVSQFKTENDVPLNQLLHIVAYTDDNESSIYVNKIKWNGDFTYNDYWGSGVNTIGCSGNIRFFFDGEIGFFKLHHKELTSAEVAEAYQQAKQIYPDLP